MKRTKLWSRVTAAICTGILSVALASHCRAEGPPKLPVAASSEVVSGDSRQENGCPVVSGLSPKRWVCYTLPESRDINVRLATLENLLIAERAKKPRRLGLNLACSVGASVDVTGSYGLVPPNCGLYWGFAFPIGRR